MTEPSSPIRILIADDHAVLRTGLRTLFNEEPGFMLIGEAATAAEAVSQAVRSRPDVVLMDIRFGIESDASGIEACREIRSLAPACRVVMFTSSSSQDAAVRSVLAGATGFITKTVGPRQLLDAVRRVHLGESLLDPLAAESVIAKLKQLSAPREPTVALTLREKQVLALVAEGLTNKEIAQRLNLKAVSARNHVVHILDKLGLSSRTEAAVTAVRLGLLEAVE